MLTLLDWSTLGGNMLKRAVWGQGQRQHSIRVAELTAMCAVAHAMAFYARFASIFFAVDEHALRN